MMSSKRNRTDSEQNMGALMRRTTKLLVIIFLLLPAAGVHHLMAEGINPAAKDSLIINQYSLEGNLLYTEAPKSQLTFRLMLGSECSLDAPQWLAWIEEGVIEIEGIRLNLNQVKVKGSRNLMVPFEFEQPLTGEHLETTIRISGNGQYADAAANLSLYDGVNSVVEIRSLGSRFRTNRQAVVAERFRFGGQHSRPDLLAYVVLQPGEGEDQPKSSFLYRKRYWLVGAAALAVSGTSALIFNSGDSVAFLPIPPGRP